MNAKSNRESGENRIRVAVIGTGIMGRDHIRAITKVDGLVLCALCDTNEAVVKKLSEENGVPYTTDYKKIPDLTKVDAVIVNLPHFLHCESTVFFLDSGIDVLVEKPMANTVEECDRMIEAAKRNKKKLAVGHPRRFLQSYQKIKELADSGKLGRFCMYTETRSENYFYEGRPKWFLDKEKAGGGVSRNFGAHAMDALFYLLGPQEVTVSGTLGNFVNDASIEGHAQFVVSFRDGSSGAITIGGYKQIPSCSEFFFTDGSIRIFDDGTVAYRVGTEWIPIPIDPNGKNLFIYQLQEFCKFLKNEESITPDGEYGRAVIAALEQL